MFVLLFLLALADLPSNPEEIKFLVIGDYGATKGKPKDLQNQKITGKSMARMADLDQSDFVVSLGDNFYGSKNESDHGVSGINDQKFKYDWVDVYNGKRINNIPWFAVLGNHDWHQNPQPQIDFGRLNPRWVMDDFFYTRTMLVHGRKVVFLFCSLDLIYFGYDGFDESGLAPDNIGASPKNNNMRNFFKMYGWTPENDTINKQLAWIENTLKANQDASYLFVVGHYNMVTCDGTILSLKPVQALLDKYKVSAYMYGHSHQLGHAFRKSTFYLQSGAGGRADHCSHPSNETGDWITSLTYGFANVKLTATSAYVDYYDENMKMLASTGFKPRSILGEKSRKSFHIRRT